MNKKYWLNRIKNDNAGDPTWVDKDLFYSLKNELKVLKIDSIGHMVLVTTK